MTGLHSLASRGLLGLLGAVATPIVARYGMSGGMNTQKWKRAYLAAFAVSRLLVFGLVFGVLHLAPRGDIPAYYFPEALHALAGERPYLDFQSSYAPLHSYLNAVFVSLWRSPLVIMVAAILFEVVMMAVWTSVCEKLPRETGRRALLFYLVSPISILFVTIDGQNNVLIALFLALAVWCALRAQPMQSGLAFAAPACIVKFLSLLYLPVFLLTVRRPVRWLLAAAGALVTVYGAAVALHMPIFEPFVVEGDRRGPGCLTFVLEILLNRQFPGRVLDGLLLLALVAIMILIWKASRKHFTSQDTGGGSGLPLFLHLHGLSAFTLEFLFLSKKTWPNYAVMALFPICVLVAQARPILAWIFGLFQFVAVIEHSFWASVLNQPSSLAIRSLVLSGNHSAWIVLVLVVLLPAGYGWLLWMAVDAIRKVKPQTTSE